VQPTTEWHVLGPECGPEVTSGLWTCQAAVVSRSVNASGLVSSPHQPVPPAGGRGAALHCQRATVIKQPAVPPQPIANPTQRFSQLHIDLVGPLPSSSSGYTQLLTFLDRFYPLGRGSSFAVYDSGHLHHCFDQQLGVQVQCATAGQP
jgi:hypothetical protein